MKYKKENTKKGAVVLYRLDKPNAASFIGASIVAVSEHKISVEVWTGITDTIFEKNYVRINGLPDLKGGETPFNYLLNKSLNLLNHLQ